MENENVAIVVTPNFTEQLTKTVVCAVAGFVVAHWAGKGFDAALLKFRTR